MALDVTNNAYSVGKGAWALKLETRHWEGKWITSKLTEIHISWSKDTTNTLRQSHNVLKLSTLDQLVRYEVNFLDSILLSIKNELSSSKVRVNHNLSLKPQCIIINV